MAMTMAGVAPLTKQELASKLVQEIAKKGDEIPEDFFRKDGFPEAIDAPDLWRGDLLIDFSLLSSYSETELTKLRLALSKWGCFQVINHGIEVSFLEDLFEVSKQFFALPLEEKLNYSAVDDIVQGYGTDSAYSGSQTRNWNDRLFLFLHPKERLRLECWPQKPEKFREMIEEYAKNISTVNKVLCKAMSRSLGLQENCLEFGKHGPAIARFNLYPRCPCPERILGTKAHSDHMMMTYLLPEVEGLQILNDGKWYKVPLIPGALFINFGELGEAFTNGVFKSAVHRVSANSAKDRISVVMFFNSDNDEVEPLSELISADQPQLYRKFNMKEYRPKIYESFSLGLRALDAFKV
ncbi:probable 2-oxoglutarate-dependent dioxygenase ANS [Chenopodium quinoa]|uniref:probable 2-oxoglutarate-dependent dioxygenase ANS n=1 Tax=Chenopodium quinoa TaxID=63459 RepID=UPI000B781EDB|nr:probable 2-oxoglutarate-dependent dioxygenase ANS [Chenopodium quinoa]